MNISRREHFALEFAKILLGKSTTPDALDDAVRLADALIARLDTDASFDPAAEAEFMRGS